MVRVNITGNTDASGEWIVDEVEHNFVEQTSAVTLYRIIETVV